MIGRLFLVAAMLVASSLAVAGEPFLAADPGRPASLQVRLLSSAELGDLVAPVALYPDALLSQVLVASTYPLEVVEAQQWLRRNEGLQGEALMDAARQQPWDASVQGLVAFPDALATLNQDIQWTTALGNAFLAQESGVMAAVQRLRGEAQARGLLTSTSQQTVNAVAEEGRTVIEIVPADPQVIYVPRYDPVYVWGAPAWGAYPPLAYGYGYGFGPGIDVGFWFGGWAWGWGWGWGPNWYGGSVYVNSAFFRHCGYHYGHHGGHGGGHGGGHHGGGRGGGRGGDGAGGHGGRETWQHDGGHRRGIPYSSSRLTARHEADSRASRAAMGAGGSWKRRGGETAPSGRLGNGEAAPGVRRGGSEQAWRGGSRAEAPVSRGGTTEALRGGSRAASPVSRGERTESWREGSRAGVSASRGAGTEPLRRSSGEGWRAPERAPEGRYASPRTWASSPRASTSSPRSSGPSPRYSSSSPGYSAPTRSFSSSAPTRGFQAAPRMPSSSGGRSFGGGSPTRSGVSSAPRGGGGHGSSSGGGSHGGGRRR